MKRNRVILVVDDDAQVLKMLTRILELEGYNIITATNGRSALALFDKHAPDLVLLDIVMPGIDGFEVLDLIRQCSEIPVVMLTGKREVPSLHRALAIGADDYIRKPFSTREVVARVKTKLRRAERCGSLK